MTGPRKKGESPARRNFAFLRGVKPALRLEGNHSSFHCGSAAVFSVLGKVARSRGWRVVGPENLFDALVVNGEGAMHHSARGFWRKSRILEGAILQGKPAILVNAVWSDNPSDFDEVLHALAFISVREVISQQNLLTAHNRRSTVFPDLSYFLLRPLTPRTAPGSPPLMTDFFDPRESRLPVPGEKGKNVFTRFPDLLPTSQFIDITKRNWRSFVTRISRAPYLVTGRHHGVYASCVARVPFLAAEGNTHKIRGLVLSAGANIAVADHAEQIPLFMEENLARPEEYQKLWDWLDGFNMVDAIPSPSDVL